MTPVFSRVMVGFDGSESSHDALALALRLLDPDGGELLLVHVEQRRAFRARRRAAQHAFPEWRAAVPPAVRRRELARSASSAARGLTELAEAEHADLIVLGSHRGPELRITPGTIALRLLQGAPCALALAPKGSRDPDRFHHLGVAYDGAAESRDALAVAYALADRDGAAVSVYHAIPRFGTAYAGAGARDVDAALLRVRLDAQELLDAAADAAPPGVNPETVLVNDEAERIAQECDGIVDLLVMGSRGYGPLRRVLAGSTSEALLLHATQPVLVVPRTAGASPPQPEAARAAATT